MMLTARSKQHLVGPRARSFSVKNFVALSLLLSSLTVSISVNAQVVPLKVVLLGDSSAAGNGARDESDERNYLPDSKEDDLCYRSPTSWFSQYVNLMNRDDSKNVAIAKDVAACSGATIADILNDENKGADQLKAIDPGTDIAIISAGINDMGFTDVLKQCIFHYPNPVTYVDACRKLIDDAEEIAAALEASYVSLFQRIQQESRPDTKIVLVGYPYGAVDDSYYLVDGVDIEFELSTWNLVDVSAERYAAGQRIREIGERLDQAQENAVKSFNAGLANDVACFVNTKALFAGHEPDPNLNFLDDSEDRLPLWFWESFEVEGFQGFDMSAWFHYNPLGHAALGNYLFQEYSDFSSCASGLAAPTPDESDVSVDIAFVFDTTGSMADDIASAAASAIDTLSALQANVTSLRGSVVEYRDDRCFGDLPARVALNFTFDINSIQSTIEGLWANGGGDYPESLYSGLMAAFNLEWRTGVKKVAIVFTDAPPQDPEPFGARLTYQDVIEKSLSLDPVAAYFIQTSSGAATNGVSEIAATTGGEIFSSSRDTVGAVVEEILEEALTTPFAWLGTSTGYYAYTNAPVTFDGYGSFAKSGKNLTLYEWDFDGDGTYDQSTTVPTVTYIYLGSFSGLAQLRVTDSEGLQGLATAIVDVSVDGDGIADGDDNCPTIHNPDQIDTTGNGVGDACDESFISDFYESFPVKAGILGTPYTGVAGGGMSI
mmetsp:Transcript_592/g.1126  ORF Transcript_592/g.1126 Transcript_592/m.1126 type:complete len:716 (-) Transcript_592:17-2164(-)